MRTKLTLISSGGGSSGVTTHNNLTGIQGGSEGEYYHITSVQNTDINLGKILSIKILADDDTLTTGDGKFILTVPSFLDGKELTNIVVSCTTVSSSGIPSFQIHNLTTAQDILTTNVTIDQGEYSSLNATTPVEINDAQNSVSTGDRLRFDCDVSGTDVTGVQFDLTFE